MKCRRSGQHARQASADDDEDEDYVPDASELMEPCTRTARPLTRNGLEHLDSPGGADNGGGGSGSEAGPLSESQPKAHPASAASPATVLNDNSDPPGALLAYMAGDSDLPAPAAPSRDTARRLAAWAKPEAALKTSAAWMQPDPVGPASHFGLVPSGGHCVGGLGQLVPSDAACGVSGMAWDSAISTLAPYSMAAAASGTVHDSPASASCSALAATPAVQHHQHLASCVPASAPLAAGDGAAGSSDSDWTDLSMQLRLQRQQQQQLQHRPATISPFADMAVAVAAGGSANGWTGARAAAALLRAAAAAEPLPLPLVDERSGPAWLRFAGAELDAMMAEAGILPGPAAASGAQALLPGVAARPSALASDRPLTLPPSRPKRDLHSLLRCGAATSGLPTPIADAGAGQRLTLGCTGAQAARDAGARTLCASWPSTFDQDRDLCGGSAVASGVPAVPQWSQSHASDGIRLAAIDDMPLDALL